MWRRTPLSRARAFICSYHHASALTSPLPRFQPGSTAATSGPKCCHGAAPAEETQRTSWCWGLSQWQEGLDGRGAELGARVAHAIDLAPLDRALHLATSERQHTIVQPARTRLSAAPVSLAYGNGLVADGSARGWRREGPGSGPIGGGPALRRRPTPRATESPRPSRESPAPASRERTGSDEVERQPGSS